MRKILLLGVALLVLLSFSSLLFSGEVKVEEKRFYGRVSEVDCEKYVITISEYKGNQPDLTVRLTDETKFFGVKKCEEITVGAVVCARYMEKDDDNMVVRISVRPMRLDIKKGAEGKNE